VEVNANTLEISWSNMAGKSSMIFVFDYQQYHFKCSLVAQVAQVLSSSIGLPPRKGTQKHQSVGISLGSLGPPCPGRQGLQSARGQQPGGPGAEDWSH
jgi:hypothetical protein